MLKLEINKKIYKISEQYNYSRSAWVESLDEDTKKLILDFTIMWNMVEHQVYNDKFNRNEKTTKCIEQVLKKEYSICRIGYIWERFQEYCIKYRSLEAFYESFMFKNSFITFEEIVHLYNSEESKDKLKLLILSCYRIRCNLFHGPKCICYLDEQKLLFLAMNELLSLISKCYGM